MCLSDTDTDVSEIIANEARVMSTKTKPVMISNYKVPLKRRRSVEYPPPFSAGARGSKTGNRLGAR